METEKTSLIDGFAERISNICVDIEADREHTTVCSDNRHWFKGIKTGADLGIRMTFAYLLKYGYIDVSVIEEIQKSEL